MKTFAWVLAILALAANLMPAVLYLQGGMDLAHAKTWMLAATILWFIVAYFKERVDAGKERQ